MNDPGVGLTAFQLEVAQLFFAQPASATFLLAGGGALLANGLGSRPTQDLDFFTRPGGGDVGLARDESIAAASRGTGSSTSSATPTHSSGSSSTVPKICSWTRRSTPHPGNRRRLRSPGRPTRPKSSPGAKSWHCSTGQQLGTSSTCSPLARIYSREQLLLSAAEVDSGFDRFVFADMLESIGRYRDIDVQLGNVDVGDLRAFAASWAVELRAGK